MTRAQISAATQITEGIRRTLLCKSMLVQGDFDLTVAIPEPDW